MFKKSILSFSFFVLPLSLVYAPPVVAQQLNDIVLEALSSHPQILSALEENLALEQAAKQAKSATLPSLSLNYQSGTRETTVSVGAAVELDETDLTLSLTQPLLSNGSFFNLSTKNSAKARSQAGYYNLQSTLNSISLQAVEAFLELSRAQNAFANSQRSFSRVSNIYKKLQEQAEVDPGQSFLLFRAENRRSLAREELINGERALQLARSRMAYIIGRSSKRVFQKTFLLPVKSLKTIRTEAVETALRRHPDIRAAKFNVEQSSADFKIARGSTLPQINFLYEKADSENLSGAVGDRSEIFSGFSATYNLDLAGGSFRQSKSAKHRLMGAVQRKIDTERRIRESVETAWESYRLFKQRYYTLVKFQNSVKKELNAYNEQFEAGQRTLIELIGIELEKGFADNRLLQGRFDRDASAYRLAAAIGELTDFFINPAKAIEKLKNNQPLAQQ